jgi:hypothetical protein
VWDLQCYATIQTVHVWAETESYQFSIDYWYRVPAQRPQQAQWTSRLARTAQNGSERVDSGLRRATSIVAVDIILIVISLGNYKKKIPQGFAI